LATSEGARAVARVEVETVHPGVVVVVLQHLLKKHLLFLGTGTRSPGWVVVRSPLAGSGAAALGGE
jgi:uncharacterized protein YpuA (DUF1002 family)